MSIKIGSFKKYLIRLVEKRKQAISKVKNISIDNLTLYVEMFLNDKGIKDDDSLKIRKPLHVTEEV